MNDFIQILITYGDFGMFIAAFLAGSFFPFSSEAVMLGLLAAGADPDGLVVWGTAGNTLGSLFNYGVGSLGRDEWILRWTKVKPEKLERGKRWVRNYGAWRDCWHGHHCWAASSPWPWVSCASSCPTPCWPLVSANTCVTGCWLRLG